MRTVSPTTVLGEHAVVLGASVAGLLAARVLSESFTRVTVVERDELPRGVAPRRGVPQARQVHALLARGGRILDDLFPDLITRMVADGAIVTDGAARMRFVLGGHRLARCAPSGELDVFASRLLLEHHLREAVRALPAVTLLDRHDVVRPVFDGARATGVVVRSRPGGGDEELAADLVVDATGRGSRTPVWLTEAGRTAPVEDRVAVDVGYVTGRFRLRPGALGDDVAALVGTSPDNPRGGGAFEVENGEHMVCLAGILGDHPPTELAAFTAWAATLPVPDLHDALEGAEPVEPLHQARFPANVRRHYERLADLPERLFVLGDALCSFNPVYGQGMTVAAIEAEVLRGLLRRGMPSVRTWHTAAARAIGPAWDLATGSDLQDPRVEGPRPAVGRVVNRYLGRLLEASTRDAALAALFLDVSSLLRPPQALLRPDRVARVLWATRRGTGRPRVGSPVRAGADHLA